MIKRNKASKDQELTHDSGAIEELSQQSQTVTAKCFRCEVDEEYAVLIPCRAKGKTMWVCTHCLPSLIHS